MAASLASQRRGFPGAQPRGHPLGQPQCADTMEESTGPGEPQEGLPGGKTDSSKQGREKADGGTAGEEDRGPGSGVGRTRSGGRGDRGERAPSCL